MQLIVNGSKTHVLEVAPEANVAQLRAQLSLLEGVDCEQVKNIKKNNFQEDESPISVLIQFWAMSPC